MGVDESGATVRSEKSIICARGGRSTERPIFAIRLPSTKISADAVSSSEAPSNTLPHTSTVALIYYLLKFIVRSIAFKLLDLQLLFSNAQFLKVRSWRHNETMWSRASVTSIAAVLRSDAACFHCHIACIPTNL